MEVEPEKNMDVVETPTETIVVPISTKPAPKDFKLPETGKCNKVNTPRGN